VWNCNILEPSSGLALITGALRERIFTSARAAATHFTADVPITTVEPIFLKKLPDLSQLKPQAVGREDGPIPGLSITTPIGGQGSTEILEFLTNLPKITARIADDPKAKTNLKFRREFSAITSTSVIE
jgi:hypothetical protein